MSSWKPTRQKCSRCGARLMEVLEGAYRGLWGCEDFCGQFDSDEEAAKKKRVRYTGANDG